MLALGGNGISKLFLGDAEIQKAYLGETLVYEKSRASRLPEGYAEVKYIDIHGNVGFALGITINPSTFRLEMDLEASPYETSEYLFQCAKPSSGKLTWIYRSGAAGLKYMLGLASSETSVSLSFPSHKRTTLDLNWAGKTITIDGVSKAIANSNYVSGAAYLFASPVSAVGAALPCRLYWAKIYKSGALQKELVPCVQGSSGAAGLYDITAGVFRGKGAANTGTITAGPAV